MFRDGLFDMFICFVELLNLEKVVESLDRLFSLSVEVYNLSS